jgi:hypothetical protein
MSSGQALSLGAGALALASASASASALAVVVGGGGSLAVAAFSRAASDSRREGWSDGGGALEACGGWSMLARFGLVCVGCKEGGRRTTQNATERGKERGREKEGFAVWWFVSVYY